MKTQPISIPVLGRVAPVLMALILPGCASQAPDLVASLNSETPCCSSYDEIDYSSIPEKDEFKFSVGPGDQVYLFPSGKSYLKAYRMPRQGEAATLEVRTFMIGQWIPTSHVLAPYVTVLDSSFEPLGAPLVPELFYEEGFWEGSSWTSTVDIPAEAHFVIFHTAPGLANKKISLGSTEGYVYTTATGTTYVPPSGERSSSLGVAGELRIKFLPTVK